MIHKQAEAIRKHTNISAPNLCFFRFCWSYAQLIRKCTVDKKYEYLSWKPFKDVKATFARSRICGFLS